MVADVEAESHGRVDLGVVDLLGDALMEADMVLANGVQVKRHCIEGVMWVQEY